MKNELKTLDEIDHIHTVKIIQLLEGPENIYVMMEHVPFGDLKEVFTKNEGFSESTIRQICKQILLALKYLHETKNIIHRDLKPENVLVDFFDKDADKIHIKLVDFGFACYMDQN